MDMSDYKRVVCIGAHPLDAEIMGGPLLMRYAARHARCTMVHVTKGRLTDPRATQEQKREYDVSLHREMSAAAQALGCDCYAMDYPSSELPGAGEFIRLLADYFQKEKVDCVVTHARGTLHPRHYYTYETVTEAVRLLRRNGSKIQLFYGENCEDLAGFTPTVYLSMTKEELDRWFAGLGKYSIFNGKVNDMPYGEYYHSMALIRSIEAGEHGFAKAYMHGALIDNE
jgi:LmbE family N-acetylglucosaminyl deacetylase